MIRQPSMTAPFTHNLGYVPRGCFSSSQERQLSGARQSEHMRRARKIISSQPFHPRARSMPWCASIPRKSRWLAMRRRTRSSCVEGASLDPFIMDHLACHVLHYRPAAPLRRALSSILNHHGSRQSDATTGREVRVRLILRPRELLGPMSPAVGESQVLYGPESCLQSGSSAGRARRTGPRSSRASWAWRC